VNHAATGPTQREGEARGKSSPRGIDDPNSNRMRRPTWLFLILVFTMIMAVSTVPDWIGYSLQNDRYSYAGTIFDADDQAVHVAMIHSGMQGNWAYSLRFTSEPHRSTYIRSFYIVLGQANRILGFDPELLFQLARWVWGYAALAAFFMLCNRLIISPRIQWLAFFLALFGSGAGYLQIMTGWNPAQYTPVDLWLIDAYMFFSLALFPHFAFTLALSCAALLAFFDYLETARSRNLLIVIVSSILVQLVNPIAFVLVDIVISAAVLLSWEKAKKINQGQFLALGIIALAQIPLFAYNLLILTQDPIWRQFTTQNETLSPPPIYYILGFALFWPLVLVGSIRAFRAREPRLLTMLTWIEAAFLLAYAPFAIQRRFLLIITIPGILAAGLKEPSATRRSIYLGQSQDQLAHVLSRCCSRSPH
jgi:hypothetical protein